MRAVAAGVGKGVVITARGLEDMAPLYTTVAYARRAGKDREARERLEKAAALFRDMGMRLWSDRVDAELRRMP